MPTRELASQVHAVIAPLAAAMNLTATTIFGGIGQNAQVTALRNRVDIVVACPGRLADLIEQGHCHLGDVEISVVDEADHMADLGFLPVVRRLMEATPPEGQRMLFSATLDKAVDVLVRRFLSDPAVHSVELGRGRPGRHGPSPAHRLARGPGGRGRRARGGRQPVTGLHPHQARRAEAHPSAGRGRGARGRTARQPEAGGPGTEPGRRSPPGAARVLVATDIAARGIHVDGIDLVIHADPPTEHKAYLHRSGRTARAGAAGVVITVQTPAQAGDVRVLMRQAGVAPLTANVSPGSALLRSIAGPRASRSGSAVPLAVREAPAVARPGHRERGGRDVRRIPGTPQALTPWPAGPLVPENVSSRGPGRTPRREYPAAAERCTW